MTDTNVRINPENAPEVVLSVALPEWAAYALAELCKRIGWTDAERLAVDGVEANRMLIACDKVRAGLSDVGVSVR